MNQILASMNKTLKEYARNRTVIISTLGIPLFFMILLPHTLLDIPEAVLPQIKGLITISMISLLIMSACQANLAGFIAADRERGLYRKLLSMPVKLWKETIGRVVAIWFFTFLSILFLIIVGLLYGAKFDILLIELAISLGLIFFIGLTSVGTGLLISSFVKNESAATHLGVGISLIVFFLGGMAVPFSDLPNQIQLFAQIHPISSATAILVYLLIGEEYAGYNPLNPIQVLCTVGLSIIFFLIGIIIFSGYYGEIRTLFKLRGKHINET